VGLDPNDRRIYKQFSLGMKQRLELAQAIMEGPSLLLLDEPSNALDSHGLELLCCIIREEHERGATVLLAAHNTPELTELSSRQFEMYEGKLTEK
jgi:bacitracin transport ATP-binding protein BcrA